MGRTLFALALAVLAACTSSQNFDDMGVDGAAADAPTDAGPADSGPTDAPAYDGPDWGVMCGAPLETVTTPLCAAATRSCALACTTSACVNACLAADANPNCGTCVTINTAACASRSGCWSEYVSWDCCQKLHCPGVPTSSCIQTNCGMYTDALMSCTLVHVRDAIPQPACHGDGNLCFAR